MENIEEKQPAVSETATSSDSEQSYILTEEKLGQHPSHDWDYRSRPQRDF